MCGSWDNIWHINIISILWDSLISWNLGQMIVFHRFSMYQLLQTYFPSLDSAIGAICQRFQADGSHGFAWNPTGIFRTIPASLKIGDLFGFSKILRFTSKIVLLISYSTYLPLFQCLHPLWSMWFGRSHFDGIQPTHLSKTLQNFGAPQAPGDAAAASKRETTYQLVLLKISTFNRRPLVGMTCKFGVIPTQMRVKHKETVFQYHSTPLPESLYHP